MPSEGIFVQLSSARRIADYADKLGVQNLPVAPRGISNHIGAVLADAALQAGVSYRTVVEGRIQRIHSRFPDAATLSGMTEVLERIGASEFLLWNHATKLTRFLSLAELLAAQNIETTVELKRWLNWSEARRYLLNLHGIGPKTYDYICCLVGIDCIAVDRHVKAFATQAGITVTDYDGLKAIFSCAADLLGIARRDFDAWIWRTISSRSGSGVQLSLI